MDQPLNDRFRNLESRVGSLEVHVTAAELVARLIEADPHGFGKKGCQTCKSVSAIVGRKFGCLVKEVGNG